MTGFFGWSMRRFRPQRLAAASRLDRRRHLILIRRERLVEAVLLRHRQPGLGQSDSRPEARAERESVGTAGLARREATPDREGKMASPRPSSVYDSFEQNMADLLGRPDKS